MKQRLFSVIFIPILLGCSDPVENAKKILNENMDKKMSNDITLLTSSSDFICYQPISYWYPEETTFRDIQEDEYKTGIRGLTKLDERIAEIITSDTEINDTISELHKQIVLAKKDLKKRERGLEALNSSFGMMLFGGADGALDLDEATSSERDREAKEIERTQMPANVKLSFNNLTDVLYKNYEKISKDMHDLEVLTVSDSKPNKEQMKLIRDNFKQSLKNLIRKRSEQADTLCREETIKFLFYVYDKNYKL